MKKLINSIFIIAILLIVDACTNEWLEENPPNLITAETLFVNLDGFEAGLNGLRARVRQEREGITGDNGLRQDIAVLGTDNVVPNARAYFGRVALTWEQNTSTQSDLEKFFLWNYAVINTANTLINRAESPDVDWTGGGATEEENKNRIVAEARAIRAWSYRHLTYCWGDVPLNLEESKGSTIKTDWERTPVADVRDQMKSDWLFAEEYLEVEPAIEGAISKGAVQHYLSELYLAINKPDSALFWANKVIDTPQYKLITQRYGVKASEPGVAFMDMFYDKNSKRVEGNTEALWVWQWEYNVTGGGLSNMRRWHSQTYFHNQISINGVKPLQFTIDRGGRGVGRVAPNKFAIELYESNDDRGSNYAIRKFYILKNATQNAPAEADLLPPGYAYGDTVKLNWEKDLSGTSTASRKDWPYIRKWDYAIAENLTIGGNYNDQVYLRLAETYLLKAEAQYKLNDLSGAAETINIIRRRAHASEITAADVDIDFILDERSRELLTEEHRRYTLLRTGKWLERVRAYNNRGGQTVSDKDTLFAIPQVVIDANLTSEMPQNPGF
ncbi:MAG: RagB/SusD family nutrient uptake outer membrane protein [Draconibacterium sp.]